MASHRIVGSEVGRRTTPGNGSLRMMARSRKRRRGWMLLLAPLFMIGGAVVAVLMWPFR